MSADTPDVATPASRRQGDYEIGYGKPPKQSRFKPGQSGNPAGSSRKARARSERPEPLSIDDMILKRAYSEVTITENGEPVTVARIDAMWRRFEAMATKDRIALNQYIGRVQSIQRAKGVQIAEDMSASLDHRQRFRAIFEQHLEDGKDLPMVFPHPDDIHVSFHEGKVTILGPMCEDELHHLQYLLKVQRGCAGQIARIEASIAEIVAEQEAEMARYEPEIRAELGPEREHLWREELIAAGFDAPETWLEDDRKGLQPLQDKIDEIDEEFEDRGWLKRDARAEMIKTFNEKQARSRAWAAKRRRGEKAAAAEKIVPSPASPAQALPAPAPAPRSSPPPAESPVKPYDPHEPLRPGEWPYGNKR